MKPILRYCCLVMAILWVTGCSHLNWRKQAELVSPLQATLQQEVMLARLEQILASRSLTEDERTQLLYERGVLYDSLGLRALARNDFSQALLLRPDVPEIFNYLCIYLTQAGNFDAAYEMFDSVLELDQTYNYARFNRGIALYYGHRDTLARDDLLVFYQEDPDDPVRALWLYLVESNLDPKLAIKLLQKRYDDAEHGHWGWNIVEFYLAKINEKVLLQRAQEALEDSTTLAERLSETNFYLGKHYLSLGQEETATALFKLAIANNVHNFVEHRLALLKLALLEQSQDDLAEADAQ